MSPSDAPSLFLGFDPARSGAAALVDHRGSLLTLVGWKPVQRNRSPRYEVRAWGWREGAPPWVETRIIPQRPGAIGLYICKAVQAHRSSLVRIACEDSYISPKNPRSGLRVARFSGAVVAPAEELYSRASEWVLPGEWRAAILGLPRNAKRDRAKAASLRYIPARVPRLPDALGRLGEEDHFTDAAGVAEWLRTRTKR